MMMWQSIWNHLISSMTWSDLFWGVFLGMRHARAIAQLRQRSVLPRIGRLAKSC
jgi:hypothetical protein